MMEEMPAASPPEYRSTLPAHPEPQELPAGSTPPLTLPQAHRKPLLYLLAALFSLVAFFLLLLLTVSFAPPVVSFVEPLLTRLEMLQAPEQKFLPISLEEGGVAEERSLPLTMVLAEAERAMGGGNLSEALKLYERALGMLSSLPDTTEDVRIIRRIFDIALLLGDQPKAESMLGLLSFRGVSEEVIRVLRGMLFLRLQDLSRAQALFREEPEDPEHAYGLALTALIEGDHEGAQEFLQRVGTSPDPQLRRAAASLQGAYDEFALFEEGQQTHLLTLLARALAETRQCPAALLLLKEVTNEDRAYRDAWILLGYCRLMLQDANTAAAAFEQAYRLDPEKAETQYFLGLSEERRGKRAEAERFFGYALQNGFKPEGELREKLALLAIQRGAYGEAAEHYRSALALNGEGTPSDLAERSRLTYALGSLLLEHLNDLPGAEEVALRGRDEFGDIPVILDLLGTVALAQGDVNRAATFLTVAIEQDPSDASAWYHKGLLAEEVEDVPEALRSYRQAYTFSVISNPALAVKAAERHNAIVLQGR